MADQVKFPALREAVRAGPFALLRNELHQLEQHLGVAPGAAGAAPAPTAVVAAPDRSEQGGRDGPDLYDLVQRCLVQLDHLLDASNRQEQTMSQISDAVDLLKSDALAQKTQVDAAVTFIEGVPALIASATAAAVANGADADQLEPLAELHTAMQTQTSDIAAALTSGAMTSSSSSSSSSSGLSGGAIANGGSITSGGAAGV